MTLSDGSSIPKLEDVIRKCAEKGMKIGLRLGGPSNYTHSLIDGTSLYRDDVWNSFAEMLTKYNLKNIWLSGSTNYVTVARQVLPGCSAQLDVSKSATAETINAQIDVLAGMEGKKSLNIYLTNSSGERMLTEDIMKRCREHDIGVWAVCSEPVATANEIEWIKQLAPDYVITHSALPFGKNSTFTHKTRIDYDNTTKTFKLNGRVLNYQ